MTLSSRFQEFQSYFFQPTAERVWVAEYRRRIWERKSFGSDTVRIFGKYSESDQENFLSRQVFEIFRIFLTKCSFFEKLPKKTSKCALFYAVSENEIKKIILALPFKKRRSPGKWPFSGRSQLCKTFVRFKTHPEIASVFCLKILCQLPFPGHFQVNFDKSFNRIFGIYEKKPISFKFSPSSPPSSKKIAISRDFFCVIDLQ